MNLSVSKYTTSIGKSTSDFSIKKIPTFATHAHAKLDVFCIHYYYFLVLYLQFCVKIWSISFFKFFIGIDILFLSYFILMRFLQTTVFSFLIGKCSMEKSDVPLSIDVVYFITLRLITYIVLTFYKFERKRQQILTSFIKLRINSTYSTYFAYLSFCLFSQFCKFQSQYCCCH